MKYINAKDILPENILKQLQTYAAGTLLYVPKEVPLDEISNAFGLSKETVKKSFTIKNTVRGFPFGRRFLGPKSMRNVDC